MESSVALAICPNAMPLFIHLPCDALVVFDIVAKIVLIYEVMARVVGWIDIDHLDPAMIALLQELQDFEIIALDVEMLCRVPVLALFLARAECPRRGRLRETQGLPLAIPSEAVAFLLVIHIVTKQLRRISKSICPSSNASGKSCRMAERFSSVMFRDSPVSFFMIRRSFAP